MAQGAKSGILRAEVACATWRDVSCALELTDTSVFIVTHSILPVGARVELRLSFPNVVLPVQVKARVVQVRFSSGPGAPSGYVGEFEFEDDETREAISAIARRLGTVTAAGAPTDTGRVVDVLLVEDNLLIRDIFQYAVTRYFDRRPGQIRLTLAEDGDAAWTKLRDAAFDLVIVDYYLPKEDGAALITRMRGEERLARTSVIAMSVGGEKVRDAALSAGADVFLHKPIVLPDLFRMLEIMAQSEAVA
jgi:CheY-like chemotaxis protein